MDTDENQNAGQGGNAADDQNQQGGTADGSQNRDDAGTQSEQKRELTQAEIDAIVEGRLGRAKAKWQQDADKARADAEKSEADKAADRAKAAEDKVTATEAKAKGIAARAEAQSVAQELGARTDRMRAIMQMAGADLADVEVNDELEVTDNGRKAIKAAIKQVLKDYPEWAAGASAPGSHNSDAKTSNTLETQIKAAQEKGDFVTAERLHRQLLSSQGKFVVAS